MANYGSAEGVAALTITYTNGGVYDTTTNPTLSTLTTWLVEASRILDGQLAQARFSVPVTAVDVVPILDSFINEQMARKVESVNRRSSRGPTTRNQNDTVFSLRDNVRDFVMAESEGMEQMGATRVANVTRAGSLSTVRRDSYS